MSCYKNFDILWFVEILELEMKWKDWITFSTWEFICNLNPKDTGLTDRKIAGHNHFSKSDFQRMLEENQKFSVLGIEGDQRISKSDSDLKGNRR